MLGWFNRCVVLSVVYELFGYVVFVSILDCSCMPDK